MKRLFLIAALTATYTSFASDSGGTAEVPTDTSKIADPAGIATEDEEKLLDAIQVELSPEDQALEGLRALTKSRNPQIKQNIFEFRNHEKSHAFTDAIEKFSNPEQTVEEATALAKLCFKMGIVNATESGEPIEGFTSLQGDPLTMDAVTTLIHSCETPFAARALLAVGSRNFDEIGPEGKTVLLKTCCKTELDLQAALLINELCASGAVTVTTTLRGNTPFSLINTRLDGALDTTLEDQTRSLLIRAAKFMRPQKSRRPRQVVAKPQGWAVNAANYVGGLVTATVQYATGSSKTPEDAL